MALRIFTIGFVGLLVGMTAASAVAPSQQSRAPIRSASATLKVSGTRNIGQHQSEKFDGALADISRHLNGIRADHAVEDLRALNPAARFVQPSATSAPLVLIDAITKGDPQQLKSALMDLGLQRASLYSNDVSGWLPVANLDAVAARAEVHAIRAAMPRTRTGAVTTQGDFVMHSDTVRSANSLSGKGVTVGVLSDSFDCYSQYASSGVPAGGNAGYANNGFTATAATDISTSDLPSAVSVLEEATCANYGAPQLLPFGDEGRAMLQIVHDVAPGASLAFYTAENGEADFASGVTKLAAAGANIIADDVGYFDEPFFQDGLVAQAIDAANAKGVAYFSAAGNNGSFSYDNLAPQFAAATSTAVPVGEHLLNFDLTGSAPTTVLPVTIGELIPGEFVAIVLEWDQPYVTGATTSGGATSQLDLCAANVTGSDEITNDNLGALTNNCTGPNAVGVDPVQVLIIGNPASAAGNSAAATLNLIVGLKGATTTAPGRIKIVVEGNSADVTLGPSGTAYSGATLQGHSGAPGAVAVGAARYIDTPACGTSPATLETFSSRGGSPILFTAAGVRMPTAVVRTKPDLVGPDGGNDTFLGFKLTGINTTTTGCANDANYPNFLGTSAATPHVAAVVALLLEANSTLSPATLYSILQQSAVTMTGTAGADPNFLTGYGFVQADKAANMVPSTVPAAPTLTLAASSITVGGSTTLTWSSSNTTGCTASGSWSGAVASDGSQTVTPTAAGTDTYSLVCSNVAGTSPASSVTLTVTAAAASSHGGGGIDLSLLLGLSGLIAARALVRRHRAK